MKKLWKSIVSIALAMCLGTITSVTVFADTPDYICDLVLSTGSSVDDACSKLEKKGYKYVAEDLNKGTNQQAVVMGYKTTTEKKDAITDVAVMDMKGGYSFAKYEEAIDKQKKGVEQWLNKFYITIEVFKENLEAETPKAVAAYDMMNQFIEDDSGKAVGDFLVDEETTDAQLKTFFLQANTNILAIVKNALYLACSTDWLSTVEGSDLQGTYDASVDDDAKNLYTNLKSFQKGIKSYELLKLSNLSDDQVIDKLETMSSADRSTAETYMGAYKILKTINYGESNLYDYLMQDYDNLDISTLYPIVDSMTDSEKACLDSEPVVNIINYAAAEDEDNLEEYTDTLENTEKISAYSGVDRTVFEPKGIALTDETLSKMNSSGESLFSNKKFTNKEIAVLSAVGGTAFLIGCVASISIYCSASIGQMIAHTVGVVGDFSAEAGIAENAFIAAASQYAKIVSQVSIAVLAICIAAVLIVSAIFLYKEFKKENEIEYTEIPRIMANEYVNDLGDTSFIFYYCVKDLDGKFADLNAFKGDQWNAVYFTKNTEAGKPLTEATLVQYGDNSVNSGYLSVHYFNETAPYNLNKHSSNTRNGIYLFFKQATAAKTTASVFSKTGYIAVSAFAGLVIGAVGAFLLTKKKYKKINECI